MCSFIPVGDLIRGLPRVSSPPPHAGSCTSLTRAGFLRSDGKPEILPSDSDDKIAGRSLRGSVHIVSAHRSHGGRRGKTVIPPRQQRCGGGPPRPRLVLDALSLYLTRTFGAVYFLSRPVVAPDVTTSAFDSLSTYLGPTPLRVCRTAPISPQVSESGQQSVSQSVSQ